MPPAPTDQDDEPNGFKIDWVVDVWVKREGDWRLGSATQYHPGSEAVTVDIETDSGHVSGKVKIGNFAKIRLVECTEGGRSKELFEQLVSSSVVAVNWKLTVMDEETSEWMPGFGTHYTVATNDLLVQLAGGKQQVITIDEMVTLQECVDGSEQALYNRVTSEGDVARVLLMQSHTPCKGAKPKDGAEAATPGAKVSHKARKRFEEVLAFHSEEEVMMRMDMDIDRLIELQEAEFNNAMEEAKPQPRLSRRRASDTTAATAAAAAAATRASENKVAEDALLEACERQGLSAAAEVIVAADAAPVEANEEAEGASEEDNLDDEDLVKELNELLSAGSITREQYDEALGDMGIEGGDTVVDAQQPPAPPSPLKKPATNAMINAKPNVLRTVDPNVQPSPTPRAKQAAAPAAPPMSPETAKLVNEMRELLDTGKISQAEFDEATDGLIEPGPEASAVQASVFIM
jgi:hypothetical protein